MVRSAVRGSVIGLVVAALLTVAPVGAHGHGPEGRVRPSVGIPVGTPIALIFVAAALIFLPAVFGTAAVPPDDRWDG